MFAFLFIIQVALGCDISCLVQCQSKVCVEACACEGFTIGQIPSIRLKEGVKVRSIRESELPWLLENSNCDFQELNNCDLSLECVLNAQCHELLEGDFSDTGCIEDCTRYCTTHYPDTLDKCLSDCLKEQC